MTLFTNDQTAIVTGGSQGLGLATAKEMISGGLGRIAIVGRNRKKGAAAAAELGSLGAESLFIAADLSEPDAPARVVAETEERFGAIHALINAASLTDRDTIWDSSPDFFDRIFATNIRAPLFLIQGVVRNMREHEVEGAIVNVGSIAGHGGPPFITSYCASKGALMTLTRNLAGALAARRIRVNIVNPGWMDTPAEDEIQRKYHGATDGWLEEAGAAQPFGRLIEPAEVARTIAFYASPASGLITGASIDFDQHVVGAGPHTEHELA